MWHISHRRDTSADVRPPPTDLWMFTVLTLPHRSQTPLEVLARRQTAGRVWPWCISYRLPSPSGFLPRQQSPPHHLWCRPEGSDPRIEHRGVEEGGKKIGRLQKSECYALMRRSGTSNMTLIAGWNAFIFTGGRSLLYGETLVKCQDCRKFLFAVGRVRNTPPGLSSPEHFCPSYERCGHFFYVILRGHRCQETLILSFSYQTVLILYHRFIGVQITRLHLLFIHS